MTRVFLWKPEAELLDRAEYLALFDGEPKRNLIGRPHCTPSRGSTVIFLSEDRSGAAVTAIGSPRNKLTIGRYRERVIFYDFEPLERPVPIVDLFGRTSPLIRDKINESIGRAPLESVEIGRGSGASLLRLLGELSSTAASFITGRRPYGGLLSEPDPTVKEQKDAVDLAARLAGVDLERFAIRDHEDDLLAVDLRRFDDQSHIKAIAGSATIVENDRTKLLVVNVNRKPLEITHGVDLVYYDLDRDIGTVVQYKRLTQGSRDQPWSYSDESELVRQLNLMDLSPADSTKTITNWRLTASPNFFKFMREDSFHDGQEVLSGMYVAADYLKLGIDTNAFRDGPKGGFRLHSGNCTYLTTTAFVDLVSRGLLGTLGDDRSRLIEAIRAMAQSNQVLLALREDRSDQPAQDQQQRLDI